MLNNLIVVIDNHIIELVEHGNFNIDKFLDLPLDTIELIIDDLQGEEFKTIEIEEIIYILTNKVLLQKQEIKELKDIIRIG